MDTIQETLSIAFIKPYYRQNSGLFLFIFIVLFGVFPPGQQFTFHYHLIIGMLETPVFFILVLLLWLIYAVKTVLFVTDLLRGPEYSFINLLYLLDSKRLYTKLLKLQIGLYLPVFLYALAIIIIAFYKGAFLLGLIVIFFNIGICLMCSLFYYYFLQSKRNKIYLLASTGSLIKIRKPYFFFFISYLLYDLKSIFLASKLLSCGLLFRLLAQLDSDHYDLRMPMMIFSVAIFGHSVLFYKFRKFEIGYLNWWRSLPIALVRRFLNYSCLCLIIFLPEIMGFFLLMPRPLHTGDAFTFMVYGYSLLLLVIGILFISEFSMAEFIKIMTGIFILAYFFILAGAIFWITLLFFMISVYLFFTRYYKFENHIYLE
jgi:hypothetical protein